MYQEFYIVGFNLDCGSFVLLIIFSCLFPVFFLVMFIPANCWNNQIEVKSITCNKTTVFVYILYSNRVLT